MDSVSSSSSSSSSSPFALDYSKLDGFFQFPPNYKVVTLLGRGGFGDVLKCIKEDTKEAVAIKVPQMGSCLNNELALLNYFMENNMNKFNIVKLIDSFPLRNNRTALAFEMLDITLRDYIFSVRDFTPMDLHDIRSVVQQMATALNALNTIHMIHSDIKLDNIMLVDHEARPLRIKLIDFGLAFPTCSVKQGDIHQTTHYRAPEIILGLPFSESIDMWSLGIVMGYMLLGDSLFPGNTEYDLVRCIVDLLGVPPGHLLSAGKHAKEYFVKKPSGDWKLKTSLEYWGAWVPPDDYRAYDFRKLDDVENLPQENLNMVEPDEKKECINLLKAILEMDPNKRITPRQVLVHPFITRGTPDQSSDNETLESSTSHTARPGTSKTAESETIQANEADGCTTETLGRAFTLPPGFVFERPLGSTYSLSWERDGESMYESCSYKTFTIGSLSPAASAEYPQTDYSLSDDSSGFYGSASATFHPKVILVRPAPPECILPLDEDRGQQSEACPLDSHKDFSENSPEVYPGDVTSNPTAPPLPEDHNMEQERTELTDTASSSSCSHTLASELPEKKKNCFRRAFSWMKKRFCSCISVEDDES